MRSLTWNDDNNTLRMIDQRKLPWEEVFVEFSDHQTIATAIITMAVRGAPAIGAAAAFGLALAARNSAATDRAGLVADIEQAAEMLNATRPTAVNLAWAIARQLRLIEDKSLDTVETLRAAFLVEAQKIADEDVALNRRIGAHGAELISDGDTILHHCNTGALATVDWGTALGVIFSAHEQGKKIHVLVDETRPRLQGARLTCWELEQRGISHELIVDSASGHFMRRGEIDIVLVGSDRTAANGDVANKIGTYNVAVLAKENGVPFYPAVPTSTIDLSLEHGDLIPIEERGREEVVNIFGKQIAPINAPARNPAFDVTPHRYVTGIITEEGIVYPPFKKNLRATVEQTK